MPHKDPHRKTEWEQLHRTQRVARRRELRRIEAVRQSAQEVPPTPKGPSFFRPVIAGSASAPYNPKLAMGAGGLTLVAAVLYKTNWTWWAVGIIIAGRRTHLHSPSGPFPCCPPQYLVLRQFPEIWERVPSQPHEQ